MHVYYTMCSVYRNAWVFDNQNQHLQSFNTCEFHLSCTFHLFWLLPPNFKSNWLHLDINIKNKYGVSYTLIYHFIKEYFGIAFITCVYPLLLFFLLYFKTVKPLSIYFPQFDPIVIDIEGSINIEHSFGSIALISRSHHHVIKHTHTWLFKYSKNTAFIILFNFITIIKLH